MSWPPAHEEATLEFRAYVDHLRETAGRRIARRFVENSMEAVKPTGSARRILVRPFPMDRTCLEPTEMTEYTSELTCTESVATGGRAECQLIVTPESVVEAGPEWTYDGTGYSFSESLWNWSGRLTSSGYAVATYGVNGGYERVRFAPSGRTQDGLGGVD